jgi:hypothetical protein
LPALAHPDADHLRGRPLHRDQPDLLHLQGMLQMLRQVLHGGKSHKKERVADEDDEKKKAKKAKEEASKNNNNGKVSNESQSQQA